MKPINIREPMTCTNPNCKNGLPLFDKENNPILDENGNQLHGRGTWPEKYHSKNLYCDKYCYWADKKGKALTDEQYQAMLERTTRKTDLKKCVVCGKNFRHTTRICCSDECRKVKRVETGHLLKPRNIRKKVGTIV